LEGLHVAIDDPVGIVIRDAEQAIQAEKSIPSQLVSFGLSAGRGCRPSEGSTFLARDSQKLSFSLGELIYHESRRASRRVGVRQNSERALGRGVSRQR